MAQALGTHWFLTNAAAATYPVAVPGEGSTTDTESMTASGKPIRIWEIICLDATGAGDLTITTHDGTSVSLSYPTVSAGEGFKYEKGKLLWDPIDIEGGIAAQSGSATTIWLINFSIEG